MKISQMEAELLQIFADHHYRQQLAIQKWDKERGEVP
jgi:hypothetical protein